MKSIAFWLALLAISSAQEVRPVRNFNQKLLVVGGQVEGDDLYSMQYGYAEMLDFSEENSDCADVVTYPERIMEPAGNVVQGLPTVCGGIIPLDPIGLSIRVTLKNVCGGA